jgi:hypothetical protein
MNQKIYLAAISIFFLTSALTSHSQENITNSITFIQGDNTFKIVKRSDSIVLKRKPFALRYFGKHYDTKAEKFYSARVVILDNPSDTLNLTIGKNIKGIPYFEPGTGMAPGENGRYDTAFIGNTGHHYLTYENENEKRVTLISKTSDILELEWKILAVYYDEKDTQFSDLKLTDLYFVVFIDKNLDASVTS